MPETTIPNDSWASIIFDTIFAVLRWFITWGFIIVMLLCGCYHLKRIANALEAMHGR